MQPEINSSSLITILVSVLCFLAGTILIAFSRQRNVHNRWLGAYYLILSFAFFVISIFYSKHITVSPWYNFYRTGYIAGFLFMPVSFFYVRSLFQQAGFGKWDWIHFIPVTIFIIDFLPLYFSPGTFKMQQAIIDEKDLNSQWQNFSQGWIGIGSLYVPIRLALGSAYWLAEIYMIRRARKLIGGKTLLGENEIIFKWAITFVAIQSLFFVPSLLNMAAGPKTLFFQIQHTSPAIGAGLTILVLLISPEILYGLKGTIGKLNPNHVQNSDQSIFKVYNQGIENSVNLNGMAEPAGNLDLAFGNGGNEESQYKQLRYISPEKLNEFSMLMNDRLSKKKNYLQKGFSLMDLAMEMKIQPYLVSAIINQVHQANFNDYINRLRITHAKELMDTGVTKSYTLEALAELSGFNNRNSFTSAFKKYMGITPSMYLKESY